MKKTLFVSALLILLAAPILADVLNPNIPKDEYMNMRENRRIYRERISLLTRVCGNDISDNKVCKAKLKQEVKEIEKLIK